MKKILIFLGLILSFGLMAQNPIVADSAAIRAITDLDGNEFINSKDAQTTSELATLMQDSILVNIDQGRDDVAQKSQIIGGDVKVTCPLFNSYYSTSYTAVNDGEGRGVWLAPTKNDTISGVRFRIRTAATGATYNNFNGAVICSENGDTLATSANDGTFWNTVGVIDLDFTHDVVLEAGVIYKVIVVQNTSSISTSPEVHKVLHNLAWLGAGNFGLYCGVSTVGSSISFTNSDKAVLMVLY